MITTPDLRRGLTRAVTAAWLVSVGVGTPVALLGVGLSRGSVDGALAHIILLPFALPIAALFSALAYLPGLLFIILLPEWTLRYRGLMFAGLPIGVALGVLANGDGGIFSVDRPLMTTCAILDSCLAGGWCYYFTSHLTD